MGKNSLSLKLRLRRFTVAGVITAATLELAIRYLW